MANTQDCGLTNLPDVKKRPQDDGTREAACSASLGSPLFDTVDSIPCEGLSPEDAKAVRELAGELLPFSPIPAPRLSCRPSCCGDKISN